MQVQIINHLYWNRFPNLYQKGMLVTLTINIFSVKVLRAPKVLRISILQDCGFSENIDTVQKSRCHQEKKRNRSRNITWYSHPFSKNVKTNAGKHFIFSNS